MTKSLLYKTNTTCIVIYFGSLYWPNKTPAIGSGLLEGLKKIHRLLTALTQMLLNFIKIVQYIMSTCQVSDSSQCEYYRYLMVQGSLCQGYPELNIWANSDLWTYLCFAKYTRCALTDVHVFSQHQTHAYMSVFSL